MKAMANHGGGRLAVVRGVADLVDYAYSLRHRDAAGAVAAARRAVTAVERFPSRTGVNRDLRSKAWAVLGNSLRINGSLTAARQALEVSERLRLQGSGALPLEVLSLQFHASLAISCHELDEAAVRLARVESIAAEIGDGLEVTKARIKRAIVATYRGETEEAVGILYAALDSGEWSKELRQNALEVLMFAYALGEHPLQALEVGLMSAPLFRDCGELVELKLRWVRGLVAAQLVGNVDPLQELQMEYIEKGMGYEGCLIGLDLAICSARNGDTDGARRYLGDVAPILKIYRMGYESEVVTLAALKALRLTLSAAAPAQ